MTASDQDARLRSLLDLQSTDGGWSYGTGASWTEPTCFALLGLCASGAASRDPARRAAQWLAARQNSDGGWSPRESVPESTWVTSLPLLLPPGTIPENQVNRGAAWLMAQTGRESGWVYRLRMRLLGVQANVQPFDGWPWYPGAAAWVAPTSLSILALRKWARTTDQRAAERIGARIEQGRQYLLARRCRDGGWNHGSTRALGYDSDSYPETTGVALLALHDSKEPELELAAQVAERHLETCTSSEASSWLRLALLARGRKPSRWVEPVHPRTQDLALSLLAQAAGNGRNIFLES